ncbi:MAG: tetratricopeptide repeat protein [Planctomycetota bacterium]
MTDIWRLTGIAALSVALLAGCAGDGEPRSSGRLQVDSGRAYNEGDFPLALEGYLKVLERRPGSAQAHFDVGRTQLELGESVSAREHLTVALDLDPENSVYLDALADAMLATGELDELFGLLERRAEEGDGYSGYLRVGRVAERLGLVDEAEQAYRKAVALQPRESAKGQAALANLYARAGDSAQELMRLRVLLYLTPQDEEIRNRISDLGEVPGPSLALRPDQVD